MYAPEDRVVLAEAAQDGENGVLALAGLDPGGLRDRLHALLTT
ncbi:hypothetical protein [Nonomuraea mesophila]|nr:hypothetical protein [Nonomuraea mesophila]